jgi:hypothetical protein
MFVCISAKEGKRLDLTFVVVFSELDGRFNQKAGVFFFLLYHRWFRAAFVCTFSSCVFLLQPKWNVASNRDSCGEAS